jgi:hypothetical protein
MVEAIATTLGRHFASIHAVDLPNTFNTVIAATVQETRPTNLEANLAQARDPFLRDALALAIDNLRPVQMDGVVFTDDRAPVENLTNAIILRYLLVGE